MRDLENLCVCTNIYYFSSFPLLYMLLIFLHLAFVKCYTLGVVIIGTFSERTFLLGELGEVYINQDLTQLNSGPS